MRDLRTKVNRDSLNDLVASTSTSSRWTPRYVHFELAITALTACKQSLVPYPPLSVVEDLILKKKVGNCVPVFLEFPSDLLTPCMAYLRLAKDSKYSFILESVIAGENIARYSFVGAGKRIFQE